MHITKILNLPAIFAAAHIKNLQDQELLQLEDRLTALIRLHRNNNFEKKYQKLRKIVQNTKVERVF